jgi:hypothetical protein
MGVEGADLVEDVLKALHGCPPSFTQTPFFSRVFFAAFLRA